MGGGGGGGGGGGSYVRWENNAATHMLAKIALYVREEEVHIERSPSMCH
jgi:hypothetical protein